MLCLAYPPGGTPSISLIPPAVLAIQRAAKNANHVAVYCDTAIGKMHADQMRLRQALLNLMSNANKFTDHGTIKVVAQPADTGQATAGMGA
jgi:signal transduction histidine kinase